MDLYSHDIAKADNIGGVKNVLCWGQGYVLHDFCVFSISMMEQDSVVGGRNWIPPEPHSP